MPPRRAAVPIPTGRNGYFRFLGMESGKKEDETFGAWAVRVQDAYEAQMSTHGANADHAEELELVCAVLKNEECYKYYVQIHCGANLYSVLGLRDDCDSSEIKAAYRRMMLQCHPDKRQYGGDALLGKQATTDSQRIQHAYNALSTCRASYDSSGKPYQFDSQDACSDGNDSEETPFDFDPAGWAASGSEAEEAPPDYDGDQEEARGRRGNNKRKRASGGQPGAKRRKRSSAAPPPPPPPSEPAGPSPPQTIEIVCLLQDLLRGFRREVSFQKGFEDYSKNIFFNRTSTLDVHIPARCMPGPCLRIAGGGAFDHRLRRFNDLLVVVVAHPTPGFSIDGMNLVVDVDVPLHTALVGGTFGKDIPGASYVQYAFTDMLREGDRRTVHGLGLCHPHKPKVYGDLIFHVHVVYGEWTSRERDVLRYVFAALRGSDDVRRRDMIRRILPDRALPDTIF